MLSTVIRADRAPGLEPRSLRISVLPAWARRRTGRSFVLLPRTVWQDLNLRLDLSVAAASFRSRIVRILLVRWRARYGMSPFFSAPWRARIRKIPRPLIVRARGRPITQNSLIPPASKAHVWEWCANI